MAGFLSRLRPRRRRGWIAVALGAALLVAAVAFGLTYATQFRGTSAAPLALSTQPPTQSPTAGGSGTAAGTTNAAQLAGAWTVAPGSVAGYRVREQLAFLSAESDGVGRTSSITGGATLEAAGSSLSLTRANFAVDVSSLTSDKPMRDRRIHSLGLQSDQFPQASFVLTSPVPLPAGAGNGQAFTTPVTGQLTIHGTSRAKTIPVTARLTAGEIEVAGSISFPFEDFGMAPPSIGGFVTVQDHATMEFDLHLRLG